MRYLVLSDIHSNLDALEAVLEDARRTGWGEALVLGDLVGYCAEPNGVVDRIRALKPHAIIRGNHDKAMSGTGALDDFNDLARQAAEWTRAVLTRENRRYVQELPAGPVLVDPLVEICHGAPGDEDGYVTDEEAIRNAFSLSRRPICLFGHTHVGVIYGEDEQGPVLLGPENGGTFSLDLLPGARYLFNPGSVGQPRDGDPTASYGIVDTDLLRLEIHRVAYPVDRAQAKILRAGLPPLLAARLSIGR